MLEPDGIIVYVCIAPFCDAAQTFQGLGAGFILQVVHVPILLNTMGYQTIGSVLTYKLVLLCGPFPVNSS